jgi:hypothetical protein
MHLVIVLNAQMATSVRFRRSTETDSAVLHELYMEGAIENRNDCAGKLFS